MASYSLQIKTSAAKELEATPKKGSGAPRGEDWHSHHYPSSTGSEKLSGHEKYRIRQGNYRVLYEVDDTQSTITIVKIGHRRDVYRS